MLTRFGRMLLCLVLFALLITACLGTYMWFAATTDPIQELPAEAQISSTELNRIFRNYKWKNDDMQWNVERVSEIINQYHKELRGYDRPVIVGGKNLIDRDADYHGIAIEINGNVVASERDIESPIGPSISGTIESSGEEVHFTVRSETPIKKNITIVGTLVGYKDGVPYIMGVLR